MKKKCYTTFLVLLCFLFAQNIFAQATQIRGKVVGADDGLPLPGVSVQVRGTTIGTATDANGVFNLKTTISRPTLIVSYIGFERKEVLFDGTTDVQISLKESNNILDEVVIGSFNIPKDKRELGYGSQTVKGDLIKSTGESNMVNALQGKVAGVVINSSSGAPGAGTNINIRGITSLGSGSNNQPIFVIDGIVISNETNAGSALPSVGTNAANSNEQFSNTNRAADINPDDIESVNILKGAAATALYGQRAANGAIIITTKKGVEGKTSVSYTASYGVDNVLKVPAQQEIYYQGLNGVPRVPYSNLFQQFGPVNLPTDPIYNNWRDFFTQGNRNSHSINFSGGNSKANFFSSASYFDQKGIVPNTDYKRITAKLAGTTKVSDKFVVSGQINYANSGSASPPSGDKSIFSSLSYWSPNYDVNDYINADGAQRNVTGGIADNPRYFVEKSVLESKVNRLFGDLGFTYNFNSWLSARYQATLDFYNEARNRIVPPELDLGSQTRGFVIEESLNFKELNSNAFLTASHNFNQNWGGSLLLGNSITDITTNNLLGRGETFIGAGFFDISNTLNFTSSRARSVRRLVGVFSEAKLHYKNILYFNVTGRNDWSSTLPANNRSFFYPSASVAYVLTESFLKDNPVISYAKLRASWARVGKDALPYRVGGYFRVPAGFPFGSQGGFRRDPEVGNVNLKPERTTEQEIGIEASLWKNRVTLEANYFTKESKDQIVDIPISNAVGYSLYTTNAGTIRNKGVELLLGAKPYKSKNFTWEFNVNWTKIKNTVVSLPPDLQEITYYDAAGALSSRVILRVVQGGSMGDIYGYDYVKNANGDILIGTNGKPTVDQSKYVKVGNALPDWLGGLTNTFTIGDFGLSFLLEWRHGGSVVDLGEMNSIRNGISKFTEERNIGVVFKGVKADGTPNDITAVFNQDDYRAFGTNSYYKFLLQDASWLRLRNASIFYNLPKTLFGKTFSYAKVSLVGSNLYLNTPFRGYDPETMAFGSGSNIIGFTGRNTPSTRSITMSISVGF